MNALRVLRSILEDHGLDDADALDVLSAFTNSNAESLDCVPSEQIDYLIEYFNATLG